MSYKRHSGSKHEHGAEGSCRAVVHSHQGGGLWHEHEPEAGVTEHDQPAPPEMLQAVLCDQSAALTLREIAAIAMLQHLATLWPKSLKLVSMDSSLAVVRSGDPRFEGEGRSPAERQECVIAFIDGIENDGGQW